MRPKTTVGFKGTPDVPNKIVDGWKCIGIVGERVAKKGRKFQRILWENRRTGKTKILDKNKSIILRRHYRRWMAMVDRCYNEKAINFKYYGAKKVEVCSEWLNFQTFSEWCDANQIVEGMTLERKNNNGNYCPENCLAADRKTQGIHSKHTRKVGWGGKWLHLAHLVEVAGLNPRNVDSRFWRGQSVIEALVIPKGVPKQKYLKNHPQSEIKKKAIELFKRAMVTPSTFYENLPEHVRSPHYKPKIRSGKYSCVR